MMTAHPFVDPIHDAACTLHLDDAGPTVEHPGCPQRAQVYPDVDAFYCVDCGWNGRISGAWFLDLLDSWIASDPMQLVHRDADIAHRDHILGAQPGGDD